MTAFSHEASAAAPDPEQCEELRQAIEGDELALHYQPIVNLTDGSVTGFEALVRWPHPQLGLLGAGSIVPFAEQCGLVHALDDFALRCASRQLAAWQEDVLVAPGFRMAVNVSGAEMDGDVLVERVRHAINSSGVDARGLVIEVTETCKLESNEAAKRSADGLHSLGVELALDDFGSQYSTFSRLKCLPFDVLKIDREFVVASHTKVGRAFVHALVELGNGLGARVIAEGIETSEQAAQLRALGAHEGQGFLWSPALSPDVAETLLVTGRWPLRDTASPWYPSFSSLCEAAHP